MTKTHEFPAFDAQQIVNAFKAGEKWAKEDVKVGAFFRGCGEMADLMELNAKERPAFIAGALANMPRAVTVNDEGFITKLD